MNRIYIIFTILFISAFGQLFAQDTTIYRQANASLFSNNYTFIKKSKSDKFGTFIQCSRTDDMQYWYGEGKFTETNKKYFLTFDTTNYYNRIETIASTSHSDTLYIKWFDWRGEQQEWFSIRFQDTINNKNIYHTGFFEYFGHTAPPIPDQCDPLISEQSEPLFELCFSYYSGLSAAKGRSKVSHR